MRRAAIVLIVLLALLGVAACGGGTSRSHRTQCVRVCEISLSGEQTIELEIGSFWRNATCGWGRSSRAR